MAMTAGKGVCDMDHIVQFDEVGLSYGADKETLSDISFTRPRQGICVLYLTDVCETK